MTTVNHSTVIALFESRIAAERAIRALTDAGFSRDDISVIARNDAAGDFPDVGPHPEVSGGKTDAGTGAAVGGLAGFIGGIVALAIPGIGPALAVGPLAAGIFGASAGAAAGGVYGALKDRGVSENDASNMAAAIKRGRVLVSIQVPHDRVDRAADILDDEGATDVDETAERVDVSRGTETPIRPLGPDATDGVKLKPGEGVMDKVRERQRRSRVFPGFTGMGPASTT